MQVVTWITTKRKKERKEKKITEVFIENVQKKYIMMISLQQPSFFWSNFKSKKPKLVLAKI